MMPGVSAGSNQVGASATWAAHVSCPDGDVLGPDGDVLGDCAEACVAATRTTATTRATTRARERVMVCPPLRCDKARRARGLRGCPIIPESLLLSMGSGLSTARCARLPPLAALYERPLDMGGTQPVYDELDCVVRNISRLTFRHAEPAPARGKIFVQRRQCLRAVSASPTPCCAARAGTNVTTLASIKYLFGSIPQASPPST